MIGRVSWGQSVSLLLLWYYLSRSSVLSTLNILVPKLIQHPILLLKIIIPQLEETFCFQIEFSLSLTLHAFTHGRVLTDNNHLATQHACFLCKCSLILIKKLSDISGAPPAAPHACDYQKKLSYPINTVTFYQHWRHVESLAGNTASG